MAANERKILHCAIYTRKSSEHGLEQDFNSLDAQREAAEAYIKSQAHEGWRLVKAHYDDGGISGGTMERPALQVLMTDIRSRKIDVVVVYKVDRLTRSLADFAKLVELFEAHGVSFVAVTQQFNTTTSMGRPTLNVLLSFAQFERELSGERIRDKVAASRRKGMWMGGTIPLGYDVKDRKLVVNAEEADRVRLIFRRYLALGCVAKLRTDLEQRGVRSKQRVLTTGKVLGGRSFGRGALYHLLQNRIYLGEVVHKGISYPGEQTAIVDEELWSAVPAKLSENRTERRLSRIETGALLGGLIFDDRGNLMSPTYSVRRGNRYRYYISSALLRDRREDTGSRARIGADDVERLVVEVMGRELSRTEFLTDVAPGVWSAEVRTLLRGRQDSNLGMAESLKSACGWYVRVAWPTNRSAGLKGTLRHRWPDERQRIPGLCRANPGAEPQGRRHRRVGQSQHKVPGVREAIEAAGASLLTCLPIRLTSIRSSNSSPNSRHCCERLQSVRSMVCGTASQACLTHSNPMNAQTTSATPDMLHAKWKVL